MSRFSNHIPRALSFGGKRGLAALAICLAFLLAACDMPGGSPSPDPVLMPEATAPAAEESAAEPAQEDAAPEPETTEPEATEPETTEPEATESGPAEPGTVEPTASDPAAAPEFSPDTHTLRLEVVADVFSQPLYVDHAGDGSGRIFVVQKTGVIYIVQDGVALDTPFLDLRDRVRDSGFEQGLLGLAFAPDYATSGYFFVNYIDSGGNTVVSRFQVDSADPNVGNPDSEFLIMQLSQPAANHNGGGLKFGPDGYLWIGTGDGGGAGDRFEQGQDPTTLLGKMLRIDVTSDLNTPYLIPADNPWIDGDWNGQDVRDEIWAVGLRNPWRYSFDRATGDLWIADVGQNAIEAVHMTPAGHPGGINYGWPILEGSHCFREPGACDPTGLDLPVIEYAHGQGDCSITGGYVYRGEEFPALQGAYVYGDYCSGNIWVAAPDGEGGWTSYHVLSTGFQVSSFGEDEAGELYVTGLNNGTVFRVVVE